MNVTDDRKELFKAIAAAQGQFTTVEKSAKNPHFNSKFAPLDSIIEMIRPIMKEHGLSIMQHCDIPDTGSGIIVETMITHETGQYITSRLAMPVQKNDPQGYGSALSYGKRYALSAVLGIVSDEDVDGNQSEQPRQQRQQPPKPATPSAPADPKDADYHDRIKTALKTIYGDDKESALAKVTELTTWEKDGKVIKGNPDYRKKTGAGAKILAHSLEALAAKKLKDANTPPE